MRKLVSEKRYHEVLARADKLLAEHPASADLARLVEFSRGQQAEMERELAIRQALNEGRSLLQANRFNDAAREVLAGLAVYPDHAELLALLDQVESQRRKSRARQGIEQRVKEIKVKINREKFSEAIALADETIATLGPDTDVSRNSGNPLKSKFKLAKRKDCKSKPSRISGCLRSRENLMTLRAL